MSNAVIMHFPIYAGGKFIINCLSLSKHTLLMHSKSINYLSKYPNDYQYRLTTILGTLPTEQCDMINWVSSYEFGDYEMYGKDVRQWYNGVCTPKKLYQLNGFKFFITAHSIGEINMLIKQWRNATVISIINCAKFQRLAYDKKNNNHRVIDNANECKEQYDILSGPSWPEWSKFQQAGYNVNNLIGKFSNNILEEIDGFYPTKYKTQLIFDMDECIFNKQKFLDSIEKLYDGLKFNDFNSELITTYWERYIELHKEE